MGLSLRPERLKRYTLLLAALIIGAAMLMRVETTFRIFGYPGLAMLFFLVAAGGAIWLAFSILTSDQTRRKRRSVVHSTEK